MNKRAGDEKYYILISLIIGMMILAIVLFFIFKEYFSEDDLNWEACRQSIVMRASVPGYLDITDIKNLIPLKCKTQVYNVNYQDTTKFKKDFNNLRDACDSLTGGGNYKIFPPKVVSNNPRCFVCARIHFSSEASLFYDLSDQMIIYYYYSGGRPIFSKIVDKVITYGGIAGLLVRTLTGSNSVLDVIYQKQDDITDIMVIPQKNFQTFLTESQCELEGIPA